MSMTAQEVPTSNEPNLAAIGEVEALALYLAADATDVSPAAAFLLRAAAELVRSASTALRESTGPHELRQSTG